MSNIVPLQFGNQQIRTIVDDNGETLWVARDVAAVLGYKDTNSAVKQHCCGVVKHHPISDSLGRTQEARVIHEPDLYRLIVNSKLEGAVRFEKWVFEDVLPSIRKTGAYAAPKAQAKKEISGTAESAKLFKALMPIAKMAFPDKNQALLSTNRAVVRAGGMDLLGDLGVTHLLAEVQEPEYTPTQLGEKLDGRSSRAFNQLLTSLGFQTSTKLAGRMQHEPTEKGKRFAVYKDTMRQHSDGAPVKQLFWRVSILDELQ